MSRRVAVIGLDCADPALVFDRWAGELPNLDALRRRGAWGALESVTPAITVPAWSCMTSGKDPGTLGVYGFRNRRDHSYDGLTVANAEQMREPRLWDILSGHGKDVIVLGVPQTFPVRPVRGALVACFLTPSIDHQYTHPPGLKQEIANWVGEYMVDVKGFRTDDKVWLLDQIYRMTERRFEVARRLLDSRPWDFFMMVEIGVDRMHHGFWKDMDPEHRHHDPASPHRDAIRDYYRYVDREIGTLLERFDDDTAVLVVSDHGARRLDGGVCLNEWLVREGYLVLSGQSTPGVPRRIEDIGVDWSRTRAWGDGGYYGRVFLNVRGREPNGIVEPANYESLRSELADRLAAIGDEHGRPTGTRCFRPQSIYQEVRGVAPDLLVYFGDLGWRSIGTVGWDRIHVFENDTGPDEANHAQYGVFLFHDPRRDLGGHHFQGLRLLQIAPTVLSLMGLPIPPDMQAEPIDVVPLTQPTAVAPS
jgi:predicted AlkP superfamily phosphohydrolase/phosphomutase